MKISQSDVKKLHPTDLPFWTAAALIGRFYCSTLSLRNMCTGNCQQQCFEKLKEAVQLGWAITPGAALTARCKKLAADVKDQSNLQDTEYKPKQDRFGRPVHIDNPFLEALKSDHRSIDNLRGIESVQREKENVTGGRCD